MNKIFPKRFAENIGQIRSALSDFDFAKYAFIRQYLHKTRVQEPKMLSGVSVIIPAFGAQFVPILEKSLEIILAQADSGDNEVIISEEFSEEPLFKVIASKWGTKYIAECTKDLPEGMFNPGRIRNMGRTLAEKDILYFTDADICFGSRQQTQEIKTLFISPFLAFCRIAFAQQEERCYEKYSFRKERADQHFLDYAPPRKAHGGSIIVPKWIFDFVAGYSEHFYLWGCEDSDLRWKLNETFPLIDLSRYLALRVSHTDHERPYLDPTVWERNVFYAQMRRACPIESVILSDIALGQSVFCRGIQERYKNAEH